MTRIIGRSDVGLGDRVSNALVVGPQIRGEVTSPPNYGRLRPTPLPVLTKLNANVFLVHECGGNMIKPRNYFRIQVEVNEHAIIPMKYEPTHNPTFFFECPLPSRLSNIAPAPFLRLSPYPSIATSHDTDETKPKRL